MILQNKFKASCSGIGQIMTEPRTKSEGNLSGTCKAYVHRWIKSQPEFYGKKNQFSNKYCDKGNYCEPESILFAAEKYNWTQYNAKPPRITTDEFIEGECDVELPDEISDIKNSWSEETFPIFDIDIPVVGYDWQLQGYMYLYGKKKASLIYTLMDAPDFLVEKEARRKMYELGLDELETELWDQVKQSMTYSRFADHLRVKRFDIYYDPIKINKVIQRVYEIRKYIESMSEIDLIYNEELL